MPHPKTHTPTYAPRTKSKTFSSKRCWPPDSEPEQTTTVPAAVTDSISSYLDRFSLLYGGI